MATKGKGPQENSIFAGKEQGHHAPAELLVEPSRKCLSSPTQGHLSMVSQPLRNLPTHTFHSHHTCHKPPFWCPLLSAVPETLLYHRIPKKLCDIVTRLHGPLSSVTAVWSSFREEKKSRCRSFTFQHLWQQSKDQRGWRSKCLHCSKELGLHCSWRSIFHPKTLNATKLKANRLRCLHIVSERWT